MPRYQTIIIIIIIIIIIMIIIIIIIIINLRAIYPAVILMAKFALKSMSAQTEHITVTLMQLVITRPAVGLAHVIPYVKLSSLFLLML